MKARTVIGLSLIGALLFCALTAIYASQAFLPCAAGPMRLELPHGIVGLKAGCGYAFLVREGEHAVLVNAGSQTDGTDLEYGLKKEGLSLQDIDAVLITHGTADTYAAAHLLSNAVTYVSPEDHLLVRRDKLPRAPLVRFWTRIRTKVPRPKHVRTLLPAQRFAVGPMTFTALATPGYTRGTMMFGYRDVVFSGASIRQRSSQLAAPPWYQAWNLERLLRSVQRLDTYRFAHVASSFDGYWEDGGSRYAAWRSGQRSPASSPE